MPEVSKRLRRLIRRHAGIAWEAEMKVALGALGDKFDQWRAGALSSGDLDDAIHEYHQGPGREIWKRYATSRPEIPLASAVAAGFLSRESLPPEVLDGIASLVEFFEEQMREE